MHQMAYRVQGAKQITRAQCWEDQRKIEKKLSLWSLAKTSFTEWLTDRGPRLAAAYSYYAIFSIGPLLIITITILGLIFGEKAATDQLRPQIASFIGEKAAEFVQGIVAATRQSTNFSMAGLISIALIVYAATNLFVSLQDALNSIFGVTPKPGRGLREMLRDRTFSFLMVLVVGVFVLASIALSTFIAAAAEYMPTNFPVFTAILLQVANFVIASIIFTGIFALMFKYLPDIEVKWRDTFIGAAFTSILFNLARLGLGFYLGRSSTAGPFGAAGSLVIIMLFIYYSSQIFFLGAKFTQVYACRFGDPIRPSPNAIALKAERPKKPSDGPPDKSLPPQPLNRRR